MAEKDFSKFQKDVCDDVPAPPPIKKICPTCITNPDYIEPDWRNTVNRPYLNEKTWSRSRFEAIHRACFAFNVARVW